MVDNCGTFFSQPDVVADGCDQNLAVLTNNKASINLLNNVLAGAGLSVTPSPWDEGILVRRGPTATLATAASTASPCATSPTN